MLTVASINTEHRHGVRRVKAFLRHHQPDVMLLQEVCYSDVFEYARHLGLQHTGVAYAPISYIRHAAEPHAKPDKLGLAILSRVPLEDIRHCDLLGRTPDPRDTRRIEGNHIQQNMLLATVQDAAGHSYRIATTHLDVTCHGAVTLRQLLSVTHLLNIAQREASAHGGLLLAGDFNAPRGRQAFNRMTKVFTDNIPPEYDSSLDPVLHTRAGHKPQRMVDGLFTTPEYRVEDVQLHCGVSDHQAITAKVFHA